MPISDTIAKIRLFKSKISLLPLTKLDWIVDLARRYIKKKKINKK